MIKLIVLILTLSSCSTLENSTLDNNEFVIKENNSAKDIDFNNK